MLYPSICRGTGIFQVVELAASEEKGGCKFGSATISGEGVYGQLKFESGIHRVQRVPATEGSGRVHTSAASVAILPQADEVNLCACRHYMFSCICAGRHVIGWAFEVVYAHGY